MLMWKSGSSDVFSGDIVGNRRLRTSGVFLVWVEYCIQYQMMNMLLQNIVNK